MNAPGWEKMSKSETKDKELLSTLTEYATQRSPQLKLNKRKFVVTNYSHRPTLIYSIREYVSTQLVAVHDQDKPTTKAKIQAA